MLVSVLLNIENFVYSLKSDEEGKYKKLAKVGLYLDLQPLGVGSSGKGIGFSNLLPSGLSFKSS